MKRYDTPLLGLSFTGKFSIIDNNAFFWIWKNNDDVLSPMFGYFDSLASKMVMTGIYDNNSGVFEWLYILNADELQHDLNESVKKKCIEFINKDTTHENQHRILPQQPPPKRRDG